MLLLWVLLLLPRVLLLLLLLRRPLAALHTPIVPPSLPTRMRAGAEM